MGMVPSALMRCKILQAQSWLISSLPSSCCWQLLCHAVAQQHMLNTEQFVPLLSGTDAAGVLF
jgi:hypothetical protein